MGAWGGKPPLATRSSPSILKLTETKTDDIINGTFDWVYEEELGLRNGFRWSPDSRRIAYWQLNTEGVRRVALVDNAAGLYPEVINIPYPKVGEQNSSCRVGVVELSTHGTRWLDIPGDPRQHYIARMEWAESSSELVIQQLNRLQNTNRVMLASSNGKNVRTILKETDTTWVDIHDEMKWLDGGRQFTWLSERDGWRHIYLVSRDGSSVRCITPDSFDVRHLLHVDESHGLVYYMATPDNAAQNYLYSTRLDGTETRRITPAEQAGTHAYQISPSGELAIHSVSSLGSPGMTELVSLPDHKTVRELANNKKLAEKLAKLKPTENELFRVDIGDGLELDAWCIRPAKFEPNKKYPLLVYVYGEPAGQTVVDRWGGSSYLWHRMLAQQGYVVMSFDNRGTKSPRGREWRKSIYRHVGVIAPNEQASAVKEVLRQRPYLDAERVGVWGWSGGGSMTLNAMFKHPDIYKTGIAIAPVPNQRYYDTIYQERYMGLPSDNYQGYWEGSAINFAHQLQGNLLLVHGTADDNCHYQTSEMLINELVRHNRPFSLMAYPGRTHSIREGHGTTRHLRELMTKYLTDNLPSGARDK